MLRNTANYSKSCKFIIVTTSCATPTDDSHTCLWYLDIHQLLSTYDPLHLSNSCQLSRTASRYNMTIGKSQLPRHSRVYTSWDLTKTTVTEKVSDTLFALFTAELSSVKSNFRAVSRGRRKHARAPKWFFLYLCVWLTEHTDRGTK